MKVLMMKCCVLYKFIFVLLSAASVVSCGGSETTSSVAVPVVEPSLQVDVAAITEGNWYRPTVSATWQWQLQGEVNTGYDVEIYDVDLVDIPQSTIDLLHAQNRKVICYFSAGSFEAFRGDADQFTESDKGKVLDGFEDERWLDIRSENVVTIMRARLDLAKEKECDGVEPDNMDGYANDSGFDLTADDQLAFNRLIANESHKRELSVALKNDLDQIEELVEYYDFSVNEQCHEFEECSSLLPFVNSDKPVLNAEYDERFVNDAFLRGLVCADASSLQSSTLILPLDLDDSFRFSCL